MSQFALVRAAEPHEGLRSLKDMQDEFLLCVALELFPGVSIDDIYCIDAGGKSIDSLMLSAQKAVLNGGFQDTELCGVIADLAEKVDELVFWYASDYDDLEYTHDVQTLLRLLEDAVRDSTCEAYIHFKRPWKKGDAH